MIENQHEYMDAYVSENNMGFWKVVMQGPPGSPYADGTYVVWVELGDEFPRIAPTVRFITPILHPNISKVGNFNHFFRATLTHSPAWTNLPSGVRP
jgi:ubiquitin-protein ligase